MSTYEIVPARLRHIRALAASLRDEDRAELAVAGGKPLRHLIAFYQRSTEPRAALIDGEIAAAWGDAGDILSLDGWPWLFTAPPIERMPLAFVRVAREEMRHMLRGRARLIADTHCAYLRSRRFWQLMGFHVEQPDAHGWCRMTIGG